MAAPQTQQENTNSNKRIKISKNIFNAIRINIEMAATAAREAEAAGKRRELLDQATQNVVVAMIADSEYKVTDFQSYGLVEENGEYFLADVPAQNQNRS